MLELLVQLAALICNLHFRYHLKMKMFLKNQHPKICMTYKTAINKYPQKMHIIIFITMTLPLTPYSSSFHASEILNMCTIKQRSSWAIATGSPLTEIYFCFLIM